MQITREISYRFESTDCIGNMLLELRLTVTETISCGFPRPIVPRQVMTPKREKSSGIDSNRLQKQLGLGSTPN